MLLFLQIERKVHICMKKSLAICLSILALAVTSCFDDEDVVLSPYAVIKSFGIGKIQSAYPEFTSDGADTTVTKTIDGSSFPFTINQVTGDVFNADSLPYATDVTKVVIDMELSGYAQIYVDSTAQFEGFLITDSIDFTTPRIFRITSTDSEYYRDYTVSVNVHKLEPEMMVWNKYQSVNGLVPLRVIEFNERLCLFGERNGEWVLATASLSGVPSWEKVTVEGLPATANLSTIQIFDGVLYLAAADGVYASTDAKTWSSCYSCEAVAIVGASDADGKMWIATDSELLFTTDGVNYENAGTIPAGFPLYGVSITSYVLNHNSTIIRYMLVGYDNEAMDGDVAVWSRLSTEGSWAKYENKNNPFACPALRGLSVLRYDNFLYALGGTGVAQGENVEAFSSFYISRDNGITWKAPEGFYQRMPADLQGSDVPFVTTVDSKNVMWIVCAGQEPVVWKGIINRLGFKNR